MSYQTPKNILGQNKWNGTSKIILQTNFSGQSQPVNIVDKQY